MTEEQIGLQRLEAARNQYGLGSSNPKTDQATGTASPEKTLLRFLETQDEQDRWLLENKNAINPKIKRGFDQLDRGDGIPEDQLDAYLAKLRAQHE